MTSSPADSPANQSASQEPGLPKTTRGGSGPSSSESFAWFDPDTLSWKTSQGSLLPEWETYSETWPRAGMTRNGKAFQLLLLALRTYGGGSSLSVTTPHGLGGGGKTELVHEYLMWPTPSALESQPTEEFVEEMREKGVPMDARLYLPGRKWHSQRTLSRVVHIWPPPNARDWKDTGSPEALRRQAENHQEILGRTIGGALNPTWVEWLMGFPEGWTDLEA